MPKPDEEIAKEQLTETLREHGCNILRKMLSKLKLMIYEKGKKG